MKRSIPALLLALALLLCACEAPAESSVGGSTRRDAVHSEEVQFTAPEAGAPVAVVETSRGTIRFVLYSEYAPLAVENFCALARQGYYDGTTFHRVVADFTIQGGDATGTGRGGQSAFGAPLLTERTDSLHHYSGALCMAAADGDENRTHGSQFYVVATPQDGLQEESTLSQLRASGLREAVVEAYRQAGGAPYLDYTDTVFGQVIDGMDVVDDIARVATDEDGRPKSDVTVVSVSIESYSGPAPEASSSAPPSSTSAADSFSWPDSSHPPLESD